MYRIVYELLSSIGRVLVRQTRDSWFDYKLRSILFCYRPIQPIQTYTCRPIQTYSDLYRSIQTYTDLLRHIEIYTDLYRPIQTDTDLYRPIQTYRDLYRPIIYMSLSLLVLKSKCGLSV